MATRKLGGLTKPKPPPVHVFPHHDVWAIKREGGARVGLVAGTREDAVERAKRIAKRDKVELVIFDRNGEVQDRYGFGDESHRSEEQKHRES